MPGFERIGLKGTYLCVLAENEVERIHDGALQVLAQTGIIIHDNEVLALLDEAGCPISREDRLARIPARVVEDALANAPPRVTLYNRLGEQAMDLGSGALHVRTSESCFLRTRRRRRPTSEPSPFVNRASSCSRDNRLARRLRRRSRTSLGSARQASHHPPIRLGWTNILAN